MTAAVFKRALAVAGAALLAGLSGGCAGIHEHRGAVIDRELASAIQVGVDNKESVAKTLGRPTFTGQFNPNDWYYVSRDTKAVALRGVGVVDQTVLHIRFDQAGNVAVVNRSGKELIASINPDNARTPTLGRKRSFFDELFGNIGTISQPGLPGSQRGQ
ncbi:outer membrane protein assembly factor BamE [Sphingomonas sp.]|uniref:outer membrane protein assembly factor BamE n=1 Tax=Sphingomonas sp. TaxID=28214 RepID=UPI0017E93EE3|nr:outer membrane protein assembly factor BamE [Sphingomonas sp.]MBA3512504.1 outer membrane protein assembly factor BamE [Sphingomonas sp.]